MQRLWTSVLSRYSAVEQAALVVSRRGSASSRASAASAPTAAVKRRPVSAPSAPSAAAAPAAASSSSPSASSAATPVRTIHATSQFTGNYLDTAWTRQFVIGSLLQRYDPIQHARQCEGRKDAPSPSSAAARDTEAALLEVQRVLSALWKLSVRPLDTLSETRILRLLARYAAGEGVLSDEALQTLQDVLRRLPGAPENVADPVQMRTLLELMGYVEPGDNLYRIAYAGELQYPPQAHAFMMEHLGEAQQGDGGDAFDRLREHREGPGYAIDSATTSEVDDAIGVCVDRATGKRYFVVYVSDATVYCPFDSSLEQVTARRLTTTTYLPEGVFFMLPKPIVDAATLREDRPCRTFNVIFEIDETTGEVKNYSVAVGWLRQLRRITYDQVQELIDNAEPEKTSARASVQSTVASTLESQQPATSHPPPSWMTSKDREDLFFILHCARIRLRARLERQSAAAAAAAAGAAVHPHTRGETEDATTTATTPPPSSTSTSPTRPPMDFSLPDPLIKVSGSTVVSVTDQVISTQDARLAVAELMIAANEVCSRVAQAHHLAMPFRGTRALSSDHLVAQYYTEPQGVGTLSSLDTSHVFLAEAMQSSVRRLSTVTRAIYFHLPLHHAGLDTSFYTHSTSPLRRYADMLVHHQLKTWLWQQKHQQHTGSGTTRSSTSSSSSAMLRGGPQQFIPEHAMATLCAMISTKQERASLLQDSSNRFWVLRYLEDRERAAAAAAAAAATCAGAKRRYVCLVGETRRVVAAPAYSRFRCSAQEMSAMLSGRLAGTEDDSNDGKPILPRPAMLHIDDNHPRWCQTTPEFTYVSDVYLPEVQFAHTITHHREDVRVGAVLECEITRVQPTQGVLELAILQVLPGGDERHYERLWMGGLVSQLDA